MYVTCYFTKDNNPKLELLPLILIINVDTKQIVVNNEEMEEIGAGWYRYNFTLFDSSKNYVIRCDGTTQLSDSERWAWGGNDSLSHDEVDLILNENEKINRILGLVHQNIFIDNTSYDSFGNLISARVRLYSKASSVGTDDDVLSSYILYANCTEGGKFTSWMQIEI